MAVHRVAAEETDEALRRALSFIETAPRLRPLLARPLRGPPSSFFQVGNGECELRCGGRT